MGNSEVMRVRLTADGIQEVVSSLKKVRGEVTNTAKAGKSASDALASLGTLFAARQLASFVASALDAADGLFKMAQKTGVAVEQLSVFTYMGQQADVTNEDLAKGFAKLSKSMDALASGDTKTVEAFNRIGLSAEQLKGLSLDQVMLKIANAQAGFADGAGKAAVMMQVFGKSGSALIPLMNDLANGGFENAKTKLQELGLVITGDMAKASQDFNGSMKRLELAAQGAAVQVAQGVLPGLTSSIDALTKALAGMPAGTKAFAGSFVAIGAASTAAAVAVRMLYTAIAGLGPIGWAVVAVSALVSGLIALKSAEEAAQAEALKENEARISQVQSAESLVKEYRALNKQIKAGTTTADERHKAEVRLKTVKEELIKIGPAYRDALDLERKSIKQAADAMDNKTRADKENLRFQYERVKMEAANAEAQYRMDAAKRDQEAYLAREQQGPITGDTSAFEEGIRQAQAKMREEGLAKIREKYKPLLDQYEAAFSPAAAETPKKTIPGGTDKNAAKEAASEAMAAAKRVLAANKQTLEEFNKLNEHYHDQELIDLDDYLEGRHEAIRYAGAMEIKSLQDQITAEKRLGKEASLTKINDLNAEIALKKQATIAALREDDWKAEEERKKAKELAVTRAGTTLEQDQGRLNLGLSGVDSQREAGLISENEAIAQKIALYQQYLPLLEEEARLQLELAQTTDETADDLKAQQNLADVEALKLKFGELGDKMKWLKDTAKDAATSGLAEFFMSLGDQTTSLTDKIAALGRSIAQAVMQAAAMKMATAMMGGMGFAGGGPIFGPGTSTSDSIPIMASRGEFMVRAAAVQHYGLGTLAALNGLRLPKGSVRPGYADGGLVGGGAQPQTFKGDFNHTIGLALDPGLILKTIDSPEGAQVMARQNERYQKRFNKALGRG